MFGFLQDIGTYKARKVARDNFDWGFVSTAKVSDGALPIETAVCHVHYNNRKHIIVEAYSTVEAAKEGHQKWVAIMTADRLPERLTDCQNSEIQEFIGSETFERQEEREDE